MSANKLIRLGHSKIEYLDYVWNFGSGCRHKERGPGPSGAEAKCPPVPCWAEAFVHRHPEFYPNGFAPTFYPEAFLSTLYLPKKSARIGVCFMGDLFGDWVNPNQIVHPECAYLPNKYTSEARNWSLKILIKQIIIDCPQHTFIFLTKNPAGMLPWNPFPDNCEVGFSATSPEDFMQRVVDILNVQSKVKWISFEPLLKWDEDAKSDVFPLFDWVAIGGLTGTKGQIMALAPKYPALTPLKLSERGNRWGLMPPVDWLKNIIEACDAAGKPVFLKDNLGKWIAEEVHPRDAGLFYADIERGGLRQECGPREARAKGAREGK